MIWLKRMQVKIGSGRLYYNFLCWWKTKGPLTGKGSNKPKETRAGLDDKKISSQLPLVDDYPLKTTKSCWSSCLLDFWRVDFWSGFECVVVKTLKVKWLLLVVTAFLQASRVWWWVVGDNWFWSWIGLEFSGWINAACTLKGFFTTTSMHLYVHLLILVMRC